MKSTNNDKNETHINEEIRNYKWPAQLIHWKKDWRWKGERKCFLSGLANKQNIVSLSHRRETKTQVKKTKESQEVLFLIWSAI